LSLALSPKPRAAGVGKTYAELRHPTSLGRIRAGLV